MTERTRTALLLRGVAKLSLVAVAAGGTGLLAGVGASTLSGGSARQAVGGGAPKTVQTSTTGGGGSTAARSQGSPAPRSASSQIRVRLISAVLRPAATAYGRQRQRARLIVQLRVDNLGTLAATPGRPALLAAGVLSRADAHASGGGLGSLGAGQTKSVTLQFEVIGAVTKQLTTLRTARMLVAGRSLRVTVTLGPPV